MAFQKATKKQAKLKIALTGPAGSGKTYTSLVIARALGGRVALADSEHGRALLYADRFDFDHDTFPDFSLDTYTRTLGEMAAAGYDVGILDSISHAWSGEGGALDEVDRRGGNNKFANGWKAVTPKQNKFFDTIRAFPGHLICTMRSKMEYVVEADERGKQVPKKVGLAPVQRDNAEYEFDFIFNLDVKGNIHVAKSSFPDLDSAVLSRAELPGAIAKLKAWLSDGAPAPSLPQSNGHSGGEAVTFGPAKGTLITKLTSSMLDDSIQLATEKLNGPEAKGAKWADALQMNLAALQAEQASRRVSEHPRDSTELAPGNP